MQSQRSVAAAIQALQHDEKTAAAFQDLKESTVRSWYEPRSFELKAAVKQRWLSGVALPRSGRPSVMDKHPDLEAYVIDAITNIRAAGGTVNSVVIASFF